MTNNIFGGKDEKSQTEFKEKVDTHSKAILTVIERQKGLESGIDNLNEHLELIDHNSIKNFKKIFNEIKSIKSDVRDLKQEVIELKDFNKKISKQMKLVVTKDEVKKLKNTLIYGTQWNL